MSGSVYNKPRAIALQPANIRGLAVISRSIFSGTVRREFLTNNGRCLMTVYGICWHRSRQKLAGIIGSQDIIDFFGQRNWSKGFLNKALTFIEYTLMDDCVIGITRHVEDLHFWSELL